MLFLLEKVKVNGILELPHMEIPEQQVTCIFGESGAGKTTLLRLLNHLISPDQGTVYYRGQNLFDYDPVELRREVVMLSQTPIMFPGSIADNLQLGRRLAGKLDADRNELAKTLELVRLQKGLDEGVDTLSGGEKQRLTLGRVLLMDPPVLLLDEPSSSLDEDTERLIFDRLAQFAKEKERSLIMVTHARWVVNAYGDQKVELNQGTIKEQPGEGVVDE